MEADYAASRQIDKRDVGPSPLGAEEGSDHGVIMAPTRGDRSPTPRDPPAKAP
jgi:hypothetical protein